MYWYFAHIKMIGVDRLVRKHLGFYRACVHSPITFSSRTIKGLSNLSLAASIVVFQTSIWVWNEQHKTSQSKKGCPIPGEYIFFHMCLKCILETDMLDFIHKWYLSCYQTMWTLILSITKNTCITCPSKSEK
jgi:hypothetical protein